MSYSIEWEESLKDYVRHHDYLIPSFGRISRWPLLIIFTIETVLFITKGKLLLGILCMMFILLVFLIYFFPMYISARCFKSRMRRHGADGISYMATIGEDNIVINNITEGISTTRNYYYLRHIINKNEETIVGVGCDYMCFDRRRYSEKAVDEMIDFMLGREAEMI